MIAMLKGTFGAYFLHALQKLALLISQTMRFVDNCYSKGDLTNDVEISNQSIVRGHQNVELQKIGVVGLVFEVPLVFAEAVTPNSLPVVINTTHKVTPTFKFSSPMFNGGQWYNNEERTVNLLYSEQVFQVADDLDGFS